MKANEKDYLNNLKFFKNKNNFFNNVLLVVVT